MKLNLQFDLANVTVIEFGVGRDDGNGQTFVAVPVDADVQGALREMVQTTWDAMQEFEDGPKKYEPSEKHGGTEYLYLPMADEMASSLRELHEAANLGIETAALDKPANVFCYFVRMTDKNQRRLTALRRASQFKGVLKKRLIRFVTDSLKLIPDDVFKLDSDFDLLIDSANIHILRPSGFEFAGKLQQAILDAVPANIKAIREDLEFVDFDSIKAYAERHPRAARYLASICGHAETKNIDKAALKKLCESTGVEVKESNGKITVSAGHEMGFLEVLDRRRYELELVKGKPERFKASSRKKLNE
ncbi:Kiwa anti-phage protein KwaB-like domain-containing protein [Sulfuricystis multivorans]|uniref:Kiwa anti-phage protein KwaB-like domain-containing protein n=1 Tax=Sulfuricystis multivorans TaxID=2211108 RepID=UPI000F846689|nr:Kiwa anti-phage protein KwaB-like domain-containing protein [Sulfuricystis multivorans]